MPTARSAAAAVNHRRPAAPVLKPMPRATATMISVTIWKAVTATATERLPSTRKGLGTGAASSSRWAPFSRSTITARPENIVFSGISRPTVPTATKDS